MCVSKTAPAVLLLSLAVFFCFIEFLFCILFYFTCIHILKKILLGKNMLCFSVSGFLSWAYILFYYLLLCHLLWTQANLIFVCSMPLHICAVKYCAPKQHIFFPYCHSYHYIYAIPFRKRRQVAMAAYRCSRMEVCSTGQSVAQATSSNVWTYIFYLRCDRAIQPQQVQEVGDW